MKKAERKRRAITFICARPEDSGSLHVRQLIERMNAERAGLTVVCELGGVGEEDGRCSVAEELTSAATHGDMEYLLIDHPTSLANAYGYSQQEARRLAYRFSTMGIDVRFSEDAIFSCKAKHTAYLDTSAYINTAADKAEKYAAFMRKLYMRIY